VKQKLTIFLGICLLCFTLVFSIYQLHPSYAEQKPQVEAIDPDTKAILEKEAELIRQMNEEEAKLKKKNQDQDPTQSSNVTELNESKTQEQTSSGTTLSGETQTSNTTQKSETESATEKIQDLNEKFQFEYELGYKPEDYRDPFLPPTSIKAPTNPYMQKGQNDFDDSSFDDDSEGSASTTPYTSYYLKTYKISGILWGVSKPKAIVTAPSGQNLSIFIGTRLGREGGVVWAIREKEVVFLLPDRNGDYRNGTPMILRMRN